MGTLSEKETGSLEYHPNIIYSTSPPPLKRNSPLFTIPDDLEGSEYGSGDTSPSPMASADSGPVPARVLEVKSGGPLYTVDISDTSLPLLAYTKAGSGQYYRVVNNSYVELLLTQGKTGIVDLVDLGRVLERKWCARKSSSTETLWHVLTHEHSKRSPSYIHRYLLNLTDPANEVDHINGNGLDNRRSNLRVVDHLTQMNNRKMLKNNTTGVNGVHHRHKAKRYVVHWMMDGKQKQKSFSYRLRGLYGSADDAFLAAKEFRKLKDEQTGSENGIRDKNGVYSRMTEFSGEEGEHQDGRTREYLERDPCPPPPPPTPVPRAKRIGSCLIHIDQLGECDCEDDMEVETWYDESSTGTLSTLPLPDPSAFPPAVGDGEIIELLSD